MSCVQHFCLSLAIPARGRDASTRNLSNSSRPVPLLLNCFSGTASSPDQKYCYSQQFRILKYSAPIDEGEVRIECGGKRGKPHCVALTYSPPPPTAATTVCVRVSVRRVSIRTPLSAALLGLNWPPGLGAKREGSAWGNSEGFHPFLGFSSHILK